jgi:hypothetical protein
MADKKFSEKVAETVAGRLHMEVMRYLTEQGKAFGADVAKAAYIKFLETSLFTVTATVLTERPVADGLVSGKAMAAFCVRNVGTFKYDVQNAIAAAFQSAMSHYAGYTVEYYCDIKPVPKSVDSKLQN